MAITPAPPQTPSIYETPDQFMLAMLQDLQASDTAVTDFTQISVARTILSAFALVCSQQSLVADQLRLDSLVSTATGIALDAKAFDRGMLRKPAVQATGTIRVSRAPDVVLPAPALFLPAGWGQLVTRPAPGFQPVSFVTSADATMGPTDAFVDVPAIAVLGGANGNIANGAALVAVNPVAGIVTDGGFAAQGDFTGGTDVESDDQLRVRIQVFMQGHINGTRSAYLGAALAVPGVASANVLRAGDVRADNSTVAGGEVEVYYKGGVGILSQVQSSVENVEVLNAQVTAFTAALLRLIVGVTVTVRNGSDTTGMAQSIAQALRDYVGSVDVGGKLYMGQAVQAILGVAGVISVNVPLTDLRKSTDAPGTAGDIQVAANLYPNLEPTDVTVAFNLV